MVDTLEMLFSVVHPADLAGLPEGGIEDVLPRLALAAAGWLRSVRETVPLTAADSRLPIVAVVVGVAEHQASSACQHL